MKLPSIDTTALFLLIIGGLNASVASVFDYNVIARVAGGDSIASTVIYALMGLSAVYMIADRMGVMNHGDA